MSAYVKIFQRLLRQFFLTQGREPITPNEWKTITDQAKRFAKERDKTFPFEGFTPKIVGKDKPKIKKDIITPKEPSKKGEVVDLFASEKEFASDLYSSKLNFIKNDPMFNLELAVKLRNPGVKTYGWTPGGDKSKLLSPKQRQITLDELKKAMHNEEYQHLFAEDLGYVDLTDDIFTIEKAEGGRIGMVGGGLAKGAKWFINSLKKNLTDMEAGHPRFKVVPAQDQETLKVGYRTLIKDLEAGSEVPVEALEAISKNPQYYKTKKVVRSQDADLAEVEELIDEKVFGHVRQELKDLETVGRKSNQSGGLAYMLGEPTYMKYEGGGSVGHAPWLKPTGQQQPQGQDQSPTPQVGGAQSPGRGQPNPMKAPRGLPSLAPRTMDPQYMQQQMMQKAMMGQGQPGQQRMGMEEGGMTQEDFNQFLKEREEGYREGSKHQLEKDWERYKRFKQYGPGSVQEAADGGRIGLKEGSARDRLQKDYESLTKGADLMRTAPPKWWLFPEKYGMNRDDAMTFFKERFMYGDLDPIPTPWEAIKKSPELVKFKQWLEERKGKANGGRVPLMYGGDPGFQFEYGGSWADWRDQHQHQMPVTDYIKTRLPKERLPFRDMQSGGIARLPLGLGGMSRRAFIKLMGGIAALPFVGKGVTKMAPKVIPKVAETIAKDSVGIPVYAYDLIEVVKAKGVQEIIEGVTKKVPATKYSYKGVDVTVHPSGLTEVRKTHTGPASWTDETGDVLNDEAIHREVGFDIKEGEIIERVGGKGDEAGKGIKTDDEYFEATIRPDDEGKMKEMEEFIEEVDHLDLKKIADEINEEVIIKKASGGLAYALGE